MKQQKKKTELKKKQRTNNKTQIENCMQLNWKSQKTRLYVWRANKAMIA